VLFYDGRAAAPTAAIKSRLSLADIPFNGERAFGYLESLCALGPRPSGSAAMSEQQKLLTEHFEKLGAKVRRQEFRVRHPRTGEPVSMTNLIVEWHPERTERILLCAHYDTRPYPDRDRRNPRGKFIGANDGGSGTAILMELGNQMANMPGKLGVDFVLFDGEEFVFQEGDAYFFGSEYFAADYANQRTQPGAHRYRWGVLLDMVGDADLQIYPDRHSMSWPDTRPLVEQIWGTARRLGVSEFSMNRRFDILDDHIKLHDIGGIPCCDIIDFNYPYWHTEADVPQNCSALSLAKVGWVVQEWLKGAARR
jgi:glutaminyl-peptide cyclotransferase